MPNPVVAIVLINYRGREDTLECLASLRRLTYPAFRTYLIDQPFGPGDGRRDGTPEAVRAAFPEVCVIENPTNNGFAGGNNVGIRRALSDGAAYVFLLNNDTTVDPGLLEPLVSLAESDPRIGIVGPVMLYSAEPAIVWSAGGAMGPGAESRMIGQGCRVEELPCLPEERDFIVGCGLLAKRVVWEQVGLFDERYFLYYEESDLCARARRQGWRVVHQPKGRLWHKVSRSTGTDSLTTLYYMRRNALLYLATHGRPPWRAIGRGLAEALRLAASSAVRGDRRRRRVVLWAVGDFLLRRFGRTDRMASESWTDQGSI
ncbi:MAG: glycosyltransferase family 2 protein [Capsulimonadales bacterium]|nr:glycosyltransferase family 2 protein [Capsulimonadales bacterium]